MGFRGVPLVGEKVPSKDSNTVSCIHSDSVQLCNAPGYPPLVQVTYKFRLFYSVKGGRKFPVADVQNSHVETYIFRLISSVLLLLC